MRRSLLFLFVLITAVGCNGANSNPDSNSDEGDIDREYTIETVVDEVDVPWGMTRLPSGEMLITERGGNLYIYNGGSLSEPVEGVPEVWANGQGGLLDIALHPNYEENGWIYMTYSSPEGEGEGANTALMRARLNDDHTALTDQEVLYKAEPNSTRGQHFGSRISFDPEGYVYFSIGDRGNRDVNPQDITRDAGKIYRLHDDGTIPDDNPFVGEEGAKEAIFSYGHRNPQGMDTHPETGQIWTHEHGPRGGDEVNIIEAGKNYGWPEISFGINYDGTEFTEDTARAGMEQPIWYWDPSNAPSGMVFVTSDKYPEWQGDLLVGSLKFGYLVRCDVDGNDIVGDEILFDEEFERIRDVRQGPDGYIYVGTEDDNGIARIVPEDE
jgi:glucose/arabinose dehydrogenase